MVISQEERWIQNYQRIIYFIETHQALPSRHHPEDYQLLNWMKYNRRLWAKGKLPPERVDAFNKLLKMAKEYHKFNQFTYKSGKKVNKYG